MKRRILFLLLLLVLLCSVAIFTSYEKPDIPLPDFLGFDKDADDWKGKQELQQDGESVDLDVPGFSTLVFTANETEQKVNFYNPDSNKGYVFQFTLFADDKEIWKSGYCESGKGYYNIELFSALDMGSYDGSLLTDFYTEEGLKLNSALVKFNLIVEEQ